MHLIQDIDLTQINSSLISVRDELQRKEVYTVNDIFSISTPDNSAVFVAGGLLTSDATKIKFIITLPRRLQNVTKINVQSLKINVRISSGGYIPNTAYVDGGYDVLSDSTIQIYTSILTDNTIGFLLKKSSAYSATNNTPVAVEINKLQIQFK